MSADNWATCPRCFKRAREDYDRKHQEVMDLYGKVTPKEFDAARAALTEPVAEDFETFREDYEFYGVEDWEITASYSGRCTECGLGTDFKHSVALDRGDSHGHDRKDPADV